MNGRTEVSIWVDADERRVWIIDQTRLPWERVEARLETLQDAVDAIVTMQVRGAPLIGVAAAYGVWLAVLADSSDAALSRALVALGETRPTAVNLKWALAQMRAALAELAPESRAHRALETAKRISDGEIEACRRIGEHGHGVLESAFARRRQGERLNVLTHCNAGWLATVEWGTALAPLYRAHQAGLPIHVWVDETRPRNQGLLTAWELAEAGIPHTVIVDNEGGLLMQKNQVDLCIVGADRVTARGDVCNKIGTYLKALAAADNGVPFYAALPLSTIDHTISDAAEIPIELRGAEEVHTVKGTRIVPERSPVLNHAFDVTPATLVTGLITEVGVSAATRDAVAQLRHRSVG